MVCRCVAGGNDDGIRLEHKPSHTTTDVATKILTNFDFCSLTFAISFQNQMTDTCVAKMTSVKHAHAPHSRRPKNKWKRKNSSVYWSVILSTPLFCASFKCKLNSISECVHVTKSLICLNTATITTDKNIVVASIRWLWKFHTYFTFSTIWHMIERTNSIITNS